MTINNGGPAFPIADVPYPNGNVQHGWNGMSLRDWFAGQALASMGIEYTSDRFNLASVSNCAYAYADAMLKAREVKP
jgi:hypothetical protein